MDHLSIIQWTIFRCEKQTIFPRMTASKATRRV